MDIQTKKNSPKKDRRLWLFVLLTMLAVFVIWAIWLFPGPDEPQSEKNSFAAFKEKINSSLRLLKKDGPAVAPESRGLQPDLDDLRARVFGDQIIK